MGWSSTDCCERMAKNAKSHREAVIELGVAAEALLKQACYTATDSSQEATDALIDSACRFYDATEHFKTHTF